jgi:hypothetical protein
MYVVIFPIVGFAVACVARMIRPLAMLTPFARLVARAAVGATLGGVTGLAVFGDSTTMHQRLTTSDATWLIVAITTPLILAFVYDATVHRPEAMPPLIGKGWRWRDDERQT